MFQQRDPVSLSGSAFERGLQQQKRNPDTVQAVRDATLQRVHQARAEGLLDSAGEVYLQAQRQFAKMHDPQSLEELKGIAQGFGLEENLLFEHLHLAVLRDHKRCGGIDQDGCSAWAVNNSAQGPLVVKNRDFAGSHTAIQRVFSHQGDDIKTGSVLCIGSLGSPGAYSSGMNASGLALVDTQVGSRDHGIGWLRYFLMTRLLAQCHTVDEAITFIRTRTHAGGGTLVMADINGTVAAVELGHRHISIETAPRAWRSNHFISEKLHQQTYPTDGDSISKSSLERFAVLKNRIPDGDWSIEQAIALMKSHKDTEIYGSLCQHPEGHGSLTISSAIYDVKRRELYFSGPNPCISPWYHYALNGHSQKHLTVRER